jgi:predicted Fe-S protein YdhL (DUF1289 family)
MNPETLLCDGCLRTLDEIATWSQLSAEQQRRLRATLRQRRGGLIASGTQPVAYFMAMLASHFCDERQPLGLEFSMKLRKAAHLGDTLTMSWEVTESHWKESLNGDMVTLTGQIVNQRGETVTVGCAKILVMPKSSTAATDTDRAAHA